MSAKQATKPCWTADCDECGEACGHEEYSHIHCDTVEELQQFATDMEWTFDAGRWLCVSCSEKRACEDDGHRPGDGGYCKVCAEPIEASSPPRLTVVEEEQ